MRYKFSEPHRMEALANGMTRCYYDETIETMTIPPHTEPGEEPGEGEPAGEPETVPVYCYSVVDLDGEITKGRLVDALVRTRYSQGDVEAILRHKMNGDAGADDEFEAFNAFAEACKAEAVRILSDNEQNEESEE